MKYPQKYPLREFAGTVVLLWGRDNAGDSLARHRAIVNKETPGYTSKRINGPDDKPAWFQNQLSMVGMLAESIQQRSPTVSAIFADETPYLSDNVWDQRANANVM